MKITAKQLRDMSSAVQAVDGLTLKGATLFTVANNMAKIVPAVMNAEKAFVSVCRDLGTEIAPGRFEFKEDKVAEVEKRLNELDATEMDLDVTPWLSKDILLDISLTPAQYRALMMFVVQ